MADTKSRKPKSISTSLQLTSKAPHEIKAEMLAIALPAGTGKLPTGLKSIDQAMDGGLKKLLQLDDFAGKANQVAVLYAPAGAPFSRLLVIGLGPSDTLSLDRFRQAAGTAVRKADTMACRHLVLALHATETAKSSLAKKIPSQLGQAIAEGVINGRYRFDEHITPPSDSPARAGRVKVEIPQLAADATALRKGLRIGQAIAEGQTLTRSIANRPGNEINPPTLAAQARQIARRYGLQSRIFTDRDLAEKKMNAILAVGQGSASKPRLIQLTYKGRGGSGSKRTAGRAGRKGASASTIDAVVVGKAVTFDSGGLCIKPSQSMLSMKYDKSGGCNVIGILAAAAALKLPLNIIGLIPAAENMPSQTSYRPDDIVRTYSGKTVEIINTDAEGRMILSDAIAYAAEMDPGIIIDMATLTGAMVIGLGQHYAGVFSHDDKLREAFVAAGETAGEPLWPMPCHRDYLEQMRSKVADLKNIGGREGGSCTAAAFLGEFAAGKPWVHIDIAAVADSDKDKPFRAPGATGFGVRVVLEYLRSLLG